MLFGRAGNNPEKQEVAADEQNSVEHPRAAGFAPADAIGEEHGGEEIQAGDDPGDFNRGEGPGHWIGCVPFDFHGGTGSFGVADANPRAAW